MKPRKIAIVHDWLVTYAGAERVLEQMLNCYPEADIFSLLDFIPNNQRSFLRNKPTKTSFLQHMLFSKKKYRLFLPLMPKAIESLDLSGYDLILSNSHAVAKGVNTSPGQLHLSYINTPMRYAWDLQEQYLTESGIDTGLKGYLVRFLLKRLRSWDLANTSRIKGLIANSHFIAKRIHRNYQRDSQVIYPPVDVGAFNAKGRKGDYYLTVSRFVPYKKIDLIVEAFSQMPDKKLVVIGDGPDFKKVMKKAGPNVSLLGFLPSSAVKDYLENARAFVFAAEEDFGIVVVEAQACGTPVIAFGRGGALETVRGLDSDKPTGVFFAEQSARSLAAAVRSFEENFRSFSPDACCENSRRFSVERFHREFRDYVEGQWERFQMAS